MRKHFERVKRLNSLNPKPLSERGMKLFEEAGELAKEINKSTGIKVSDGNLDTIRDGVLDEAADTIQCVFSVIDEFNNCNKGLEKITYEELTDRIGVKNDKWFDSYKKLKV